MDIPFGDALFLMSPESDLLEEAYLDLKLLLCVSMLLIKRERIINHNPCGKGQKVNRNLGEKKYDWNACKSLNLLITIMYVDYTNEQTKFLCGFIKKQLLI